MKRKKKEILSKGHLDDRCFDIGRHYPSHEKMPTTSHQFRNVHLCP